LQPFVALRKVLKRKFVKSGKGKFLKRWRAQAREIQYSSILFRRSRHQGNWASTGTHDPVHTKELWFF
jgi:hypothetical protein